MKWEGHHKPGFWLAAAGILLAASVVILGAFTRLVDAGLGCPDWPGCYGHLLWPDDPDEILAANTAFPDMPVIDGKPWPEMVHRYLAGSLGLLIAGLAVYAVKYRREDNYPFRQIIFMAILVIWQALFGMWTVTLKLWPQIVTLHLMGGFATFVLVTVLAQRLGSYRWQLSSLDRIALSKQRVWILLGLIVVAMQVFLGGWVASNYAAFGCPDFPTCTGKWWPDMDLAHGFNFFQTIGPNYLGGLMESDGRTAIHFIHRLGAIVTTVYLVFLGLRVYAQGVGVARKMIFYVWALLAIQIVLGVTNVEMSIPLGIAVAHNFVGVLLLAAIAALLTQINLSQEIGQGEKNDK